MPKSIRSRRHELLAEELRRHREMAGLTQFDVASRLGRHQPFIANIESGQRRVDIVELLDIAEIIGLDPHALISALQKTR